MVKIREEKVARTTPRHRFLLVEANEEFRELLRLSARDARVDCVVAREALRASGIKVIDLTDAVLARIGGGLSERELQSLSRRPTAEAERPTPSAK